jgi:Fe-S cluster assembly protein SufD
MTDRTHTKEWYLESFKAFEEGLNGQAAGSFHKIRKDAIKKFEEFDFPTIKNEEWKYTNIAQLLKYNFAKTGKTSVSQEEIEKNLIHGLPENIIVLVNGVFNNELTKLLPQAKGVTVDSFSNVLKNNPDFISEYFSRYAKIENGFVALNTAFAQDGIVINVPDNKIIEDPIHILNFTGNDGENALAQPRNLIVLGKGSQVKLVESYHSIGESANLTNVVTEIISGENSYLELYKIQDENTASFHINMTQVEQKKNSNFTIYTVSLGGALTRNDLNTELDDENSQANLYGLYIIDGAQHVDNHTLIDHAKPHCESRELYKGVLGGKSRGVFNGKVFVRKDAQKTNAYQSNKAMLLTKDAMIDTKPQLEIYADDVKCSHGAAIGQLDDESVFYLRSRGIGEEQARAVLIRAFANDVFDEIKLEPLHEHLNNLVFKKLK